MHLHGMQADTTRLAHIGWAMCRLTAVQVGQNCLRPIEAWLGIDAPFGFTERRAPIRQNVHL
jgi:hypothetical protein